MIRLEQITKTYKIGNDTLKAADGISLEIQKGEFVALRGPSGSGKSTIMNILGCLDRDYSGKYFLEGKDVSGLGEDELAKIRNQMISFVHQNFNLLPRLTALENAELPLVYAGVSKKERVLRAKQALAMVGLSDRENHLPVQLSGGQQQRVAIARSLINNAPLILADEPTGNLDSKSSVEVMSILQRLNQKGTMIVLVTHEPDIAEWAGRAIYFRDGRLGA